MLFQSAFKSFSDAFFTLCVSNKARRPVWERDPKTLNVASVKRWKDGNVCRINVNQQKEFLLGGSRSLSELFQSISFPWS